MSKYNSFIKREYDYAIRIAAFLGSQYPDGYSSISDVSRLLMISHSITSKIAHKLQKTGILKSYRGRNGGIALAKDPNTISFYNILEAMGFNSTMNDCIVDPGICPLVDMCKVHLYFLNMEKDIHHSLKNTFTSSFLFKEDDLITARKKCLSLT